MDLAVFYLGIFIFFIIIPLIGIVFLIRYILSGRGKYFWYFLTTLSFWVFVWIFFFFVLTP